MEDKSFIDLRTPMRRDFSDFFLERNPFPTLGIPEELPVITVDREGIIEQFKNAVFTVLDGKKSILTVLVGEYGSGKSHLLKVFKQNINAQILSRNNGTIAGYVKSPGENFRDFVLAYMDNIGREILQELASDMVKEFLRLTPSIEEFAFSREAQQKLQEGDFFSDEVFKGIRQLDLTDKIIDSHIRGLRNDDMAKAFLSLPNPEFASLGWRWLSGDKLSRSDKDRLRITSSIGSENAYEVFLDFIKMLRQIGITNFAIFVDELEKITSLHPLKRDRYQNDLRQLIDDNPNNMIFYFAIAPRQWQALTKEQTALVRRLSGNWHVLDEFEEKDIQELVERYLYTGRPPNFSGKIAKERFSQLSPSLCPFSEESLMKIRELTEGVVSRILLLCEKSLNYLHDHKREYKYINAELVQKAYDQS
jgi:hypothetical protein